MSPPTTPAFRRARRVIDASAATAGHGGPALPASLAAAWQHAAAIRPEDLGDEPPMRGLTSPALDALVDVALRPRAELVLALADAHPWASSDAALRRGLLCGLADLEPTVGMPDGALTSIGYEIRTARDLDAAGWQLRLDRPHDDARVLVLARALLAVAHAAAHDPRYAG